MKLNSVFFLSFLLLQGCFKSTPNCSDEKTIKLIKDTVSNSLTENIQERLKKDGVAKDVFLPNSMNEKINVLRIRTDKYNESIKKYECRADLQIELSLEDFKYFSNNSWWGAPVNMEISNTGIVNTPISYISHKTDDNKHYIESSDLIPIAKFLSTITSLRIDSERTIEKSRGIDNTQKRVKLIGVYDGGNTGYNFLNELDENNFYYMNKLPEEDFEKIADVCKYDSMNLHKKCVVNVVMQGSYITKIESVEIIK
jgi:hypothetical protein